TKRLPLCSVAREGHARVEAIRPAPSEPGPGEVHVAVARAAGAVDLDRGLVVKDAGDARSGRAVSDSERAHDLLAVVDRRPVLTAGVLVRRHPHVPSRLRWLFRVDRALGACEQPPGALPPPHGIA